MASLKVLVVVIPQTDMVAPIPALITFQELMENDYIIPRES
jgi:hypothetical protein